MSVRLVFAKLSLLFGLLVCASARGEPLAFSLEFRRTGERLVKVSVATGANGESSIRSLVIDSRAGPESSHAIRDRQRVLSADEASSLQVLVEAVQPPVPRKEVMAEGSVWVFKRGQEESWLFRSPTFKPKERKVDGMRALGEYVWGIEGLRSDAGRCF